MDRLVLLREPREQRRQGSAPSEDLSDDDDYTVSRQYIPHRRNDFPPLAYRPSDTPPTRVRYTIVDRVFDEFEVPVYILRPWKQIRDEEDKTSALKPALVAEFLDDIEIKPLDLVAPLHGTRSPQATALSSSRHTSISEDTSSSEPGNRPSHPRFSYNPNDDAIKRVDLFEIERYVSPRELEEYENWRFAHPQDADKPVVAASVSRASSEAQRQADRDIRALGRTEVKEIQRKGRPPKKLKTLSSSIASPGPLVASQHEKSQSKGTQRYATPLYRQDGNMILDGVVSSIEPLLDQEMKEEELLAAFQDVTVTKSDRKHRARSQRSRTRSRSISARAPKHIERVTSASQSRLKCTNGRVTGSIQCLESGPFAQKTMNKKAKAQDDLMHLPAWADATKKKKPRSTNAPAAVSRQSQSRLESVGPVASKSRHNISMASNGHMTSTSKSTIHVSLGSKQKLQETVKPESLEDGVEPADEEYEISHVVGHDDSSGKRYYLVAWVGYTDSEATWLTASELEDAQDALQDYLDGLARYEPG